MLAHVGCQDFYFSYSYDITSPLQSNVSVGHGHNCSSPSAEGDNENQWQDESSIKSSSTRKRSRFKLVLDETTRALGSTMFSWNHHLLDAVSHLQDKRWCTPVIHGYFEQKAISILGRTIHIAVASRRSRNFAGTRYLKRGVNSDGDVANEVETEQIVWEER